MSAGQASIGVDKHKNERTRALNLFSIVTVLAVVVGLLMALFYAGTDVDQGDVQRLFYLHMGGFFGAFGTFGVAVFAGVQYLRTREAKWDALALACIEVGIVLSFVNLATGSIWARPIWNTWWTWDPRLTSAAVMELTYVAYLMLRNGIENVETRRRFASVYGILAFSTVILTLVIIRIRPDTIHPAVIGTGAANAEGGFAMTQGIGITMAVNVLVWVFLLAPALVWWRIRLENALERVQRLKTSYLES
jgi:heme exporter protein C